jgi:hypothetical protein
VLSLVAHYGYSYFSRNPPAITGGVPESQRGAVRLLLGCLFPQVDALPGPDGGRETKAADGQMGGEIGMSDRRSGLVRSSVPRRRWLGE